MDVREKLIDLILDAKRTDPETGSFTEYLADCLINNGVTVQEWVSVEDRLPEPFVTVLACIPSEEPLPTVHESYIADHGAWVCILTAERYKTGEVTHWMPLPEPPKGE